MDRYTTQALMAATLAAGDINGRDYSKAAYFAMVARDLYDAVRAVNEGTQDVVAGVAADDLKADVERMERRLREVEAERNLLAAAADNALAETLTGPQLNAAKFIQGRTSDTLRERREVLAKSLGVLATVKPHDIGTVTP